MIDNILVEKKCKKIELFLSELNQITISGFDEFKKSVVERRFVERNIELCIEQMVDICRHIISRLRTEEPESYRHCFDLLVQEEVISPEHGDLYKKMISYRNLLVHVYDSVDDSITYTIFKEKRNDFMLFVNDIRQYVGG